MSWFYENIGEIQNTGPMPSNGQLVVPDSLLEAVPYRIRNIPHDSIFFAKPSTVLRDASNGALMIDTNDIVAELPQTELQLRTRPVLMRVLQIIGKEAVDGYLVDLRHIAHLLQRPSGLAEGEDSDELTEMRNVNATVLPLGMVTNNGIEVRYDGREDLLPFAKTMIGYVDAFIDSRRAVIEPFQYVVASGVQVATSIPEQASEQVVGSDRFGAPLTPTFVSPADSVSET